MPHEKMSDFLKLEKQFRRCINTLLARRTKVFKLLSNLCVMGNPITNAKNNQGLYLSVQGIVSKFQVLQWTTKQQLFSLHIAMSHTYAGYPQESFWGAREMSEI